MQEQALHLQIQAPQSLEKKKLCHNRGRQRNRAADVKNTKVGRERNNQDSINRFLVCASNTTAIS